MCARELQPRRENPIENLLVPLSELDSRFEVRKTYPLHRGTMSKHRILEKRAFALLDYLRDRHEKQIDDADVVVQALNNNLAN